MTPHERAARATATWVQVHASIDQIKLTRGSLVNLTNVIAEAIQEAERLAVEIERTRKAVGAVPDASGNGRGTPRHNMHES